MPNTVAQHAVATFTSPVNGSTPIDANTVRGNDNTTRTSYNNHDADPGIHLQSSTLASRPIAGTAGRKWITADTSSYRVWYDDGTTWQEVTYLSGGGGTISGSLLITGTLGVTGLITATGGVLGNASTATTLATARNINGVSFNGSANITVTAAAGTLTGATLASNVLASSLTSVGTLSSLTVSGNLTVDTNTLFVDAVNNRVGVNKASPASALDVDGAIRINADAASVSLYTNEGWRHTGSGSLYIDANQGGAANSVIIRNGSGFASQLILSGSGNFGVGVTPSAWGTGGVLEAKTKGSAFFGFGANETYLTSNAFLTGGAWYYANSSTANMYLQNAGQHQWFTAPSGTAGAAISFTQALTLHASGGHSLGTSTDPGAGVFLANTGVQAPRLSTTTAGSFGSALTATAYRIYADATYGAAIAGFGTASDVTLIGRGGNLLIQGTDNGGAKLGFYGTSPQAKPTVTGSRGANAALASLLTALANLGILTDSST